MNIRSRSVFQTQRFGNAAPIIQARVLMPSLPEPLKHELRPLLGFFSVLSANTVLKISHEPSSNRLKVNFTPNYHGYGAWQEIQQAPTESASNFFKRIAISLEPEKSKVATIRNIKALLWSNELFVGLCKASEKEDIFTRLKRLGSLVPHIGC